jgi:DNA-binding response OmpR family regulator
MRVLLVEDDDTIAEPLADGLRRYGFTVERSSTGAAALGMPPGDIVLLDLGLPDMDGIDVCRMLRQVSQVPIIMLTARGAEADRVVGLELGADDYIAKPFSIRELIARMRAVARRFHAVPELVPEDPAGTTGTRIAGPGTASPLHTGPLHRGRLRTGPLHTGPLGTGPVHAGALHTGAQGGPPRQDRGPTGRPQIIGALSIDRRTRQVLMAGRRVDLTPKEFDLLAVLAQDPGAVYERGHLLETVWTERFFGPTRTLDVHVAALRRKLGDPGSIETVRGVGFRLRAPGGS